MVLTTERAGTKRTINCNEILSVSIEDLLPYHQTGDRPLPMKKDQPNEVDLKRIEGQQLLKMAARYAEAKRATAIQYQHPSASCPANGYESRMVLVDKTQVVLASSSYSVGEKSIGVNGYVALSPKGRKAVLE